VPVPPPPGQPVGDVRWKPDYSQPTAEQAGFVVLPTNRNPPAPEREGTRWPPLTTGPAGFPPPPGGSARFLRIPVPPGTPPPDKPFRRYEVLPDHRRFPDGDEAWFGFAFHLDSAFPLSSPGWTVIWQLHGEPSTGSPPVSFLAQQGGLWIDGGWGRPDVADPMALHYKIELMELAADRWYSCVCQVVFDSTPGRGAVSLWVDGVDRLSRYKPPCGTNYAGAAYLKNGVYCSDTVPGTGTISFAAQSLGTGYGAVDPLNA
jgi:hypothetical protein